MDGRWTRALVTGASSGIGAAMAAQLAGSGTDVVLVARRADRLEELAEKLRTGGRQIDVLAADLGAADELARVEDRLRADPPIDLLVNNAGFGSFGQFSALELDTEVDQIALNVTAVVRLTHAALGGMVASDRGTVINVSSFGSLQPGPRFATYVATKAFVTSLSESLHEELRGTGVSVTAVLPGFTRTEFQSTASAEATTIPDALWQTAEAVAREALAGAAKGRAIVITGLANRVAGSVMDRLPRVVKRRTAGAVTRRM